MVEGNYGKEYRADHHGHRPGLRDIGVTGFQKAGDYHQDALPENGRKAVEGASDADKEGLVALVEGDHVVPVRRDVMSRRGEGRDPEDNEGQDKERDRGVARGNDLRRRTRQGQGQPYEGRAHQNLHGDHPPALGPDNVHKGAPEGFYDPGKIEDTGIGRYVRVGHSHLLEHDG